MTKKLNSFTASQASTSILPRLLFKRNQPKPEIFGGKIAATGHPIALILWRAFDALQSPRQGTLCGSVWRRHGCLVSCDDRGLGLTPTASALPSQCLLR